MEKNLWDNIKLNLGVNFSIEQAIKDGFEPDVNVGQQFISKTPEDFIEKFKTWVHEMQDSRPDFLKNIERYFNKL